MFSNLTIYNDLLDADECRGFIQKFQESAEQVEKMSNRYRLKFDDSSFATSLWERLTQHYPYRKVRDEYGDKWVADHLNSRFRLSKYKPGQEFGPHYDGYYQSDFRTRSFATLTIYLNHGDFTGGETHFIDYGLAVTPKRGRAFLFLCEDVLHEGLKVLDGCKYILRTDVMYRCTKMADL
jgi:hypothetical protein